MCALFYVPTMKENKSSVFQKKKKLLKDCTMFPALSRYLEWFKLFFNIYGFINGAVIYTHVCILVCI